MIIKIGIIDSDVDYVGRLENVLSSYDDVEIYTYTDRENLKENLGNTRFDVLLLTNEMYYKGIENYSKLVLAFLDETRVIDDSLIDFAKVQKYQRISNIYKTIIEQYASVAGIANDITNKNAKVITYWSPVGGSGKTTISLATATKLAKEGKSVFYINFETYPSDTAYLENTLGRGIRELASDMNKDINFELKIRGILEQKRPNFFYMNHFDKVIDFKDTRPEELEKLIDIVVQNGHFDYVIVDIDSSINSKNQAVLEMADRVFLVTSPDQYATQKMSAYYEELSNKELDRDKYYSIHNKMVSNLSIDIPMEIKCVANLPHVSGDNNKIIDALANSAEMDKMVGVL